MKSIMLNQNEDTFIYFYIMIPSNFEEYKREIINQVCIEHKNCKITFFEMGDSFKEYNIGGFGIWTTAMFYKIELQNILPNEKKILFLDCDTLIYKDLNQIYNVDIEDKYYTGMLEGEQMRRCGYNLTNTINAGTLLINLEQLRKDNISQKIKDFLNENHLKVKYPDQDVINAVCFRKNGYFHPKFVIPGFCNEDLIKRYVNSLFIKLKLRDVIKSYKDPYIYHLIIHYKPWYGIANINGVVCFDSITRFYEMARKTSYYYEILNHFKVIIKK